MPALRRLLAFVGPILVSGLFLASPRSAAAVSIQVNYVGGGSLYAFGGSLGVFEVTTGTETFALYDAPYTFWLEGFGESYGANLGGVAFQFTSFSSGGLVDADPNSVGYLDFFAGDPYDTLGTGYHAKLREGNTAWVRWSVLGVSGTQTSTVTFLFTTVPEPSAPWLVGLGGLLLALRRSHSLSGGSASRRLRAAARSEVSKPSVNDA